MRALLVFAAALAAFAADNVLTLEEQRAGWQLLFDGKSMHGWIDPASKNPPGDAWLVEDGCLKARPGARITEDLISEESFADFELVFDWRVAPGGNTGVKYRIQRVVFLDNAKLQPGEGGFEGMLGREIASPRCDRAALAPGARGQEYVVAFEMQLIDDERHPDAKRDAKHTTGALYSMLAPTSHPARPAGEWNTGRIVARGDSVEHWINGVKVLEGSLRSKQALQGITERWRHAPAVLKDLSDPKPSGPISLQHHGDEVWFRNIKIRRLD